MQAHIWGVVHTDSGDRAGFHGNSDTGDTRSEGSIYYIHSSDR